MSLKSERPLWRQVIRLATRLRHGRQMAHAQDWLPHLSISLASESTRGEVFYKGKPIATLLPHDTFRHRVGTECTIVGSGPSIRTQRIDRLPPQSCVLLNGALTLSPFPVAEPLAVAIEDERFVWRHFDMMRKGVPVGTLCLLSVEVLRVIAEHDPMWLQDRPVMLIDNLLKPYNAPRRSLESPDVRDLIVTGDQVAISVAPERGVVPAGSIAITALQWAMGAGPERIAFAGVDISNAGDPRFYETEKDRAPSKLLAARERMLRHVAFASGVCRERGIHVETYSEASALRDAGIVYSPRLDAAAA